MELLFTKISIDTTNIINTPITYELSNEYEEKTLRTASDFILQRERVKGGNYSVIAITPENSPQVISKPIKTDLVEDKEKNSRYVLILLQYREKMIAHFSKCLMNYYYGSLELIDIYNPPTNSDNKLKKSYSNLVTICKNIGEFK